MGVKIRSGIGIGHLGPVLKFDQFSRNGTRKHNSTELDFIEKFVNQFFTGKWSIKLTSTIVDKNNCSNFYNFIIYFLHMFCSFIWFYFSLVFTVLCFFTFLLYFHTTFVVYFLLIFSLIFLLFFSCFLTNFSLSFFLSIFILQFFLLFVFLFFLTILSLYFKYTSVLD